ncbi:MAG: 4Fe-4S binding protein [Candidatus Nealsonbacteria bacterium DGGOD1a]|nr:MAG: 4Fe-4S binding protein [Candidatus Nealsonbacteria bacterium DGGOD1a]
MTVLINFKICDNAKECSGIAVCPTGALSWDEKKKSIKINNKKCISCGKCQRACGVEAIKVAKNEKEYVKIKKEINNDSRKATDLFIDRFGAQPVTPMFLVAEDKFTLSSLESKKPAMVEFFNENSIECLLRSIPIKDLVAGMKINYEKIELKTALLLGKYQISKLPALLFFKDGKLFGKIEGYYDLDKKGELIKLVGEIVNRGK